MAERRAHARDARDATKHRTVGIFGLNDGLHGIVWHCMPLHCIALTITHRTLLLLVLALFSIATRLQDFVFRYRGMIRRSG